MDPNTKELLSNLHDLHKQATEERSHYYVGRIVAQAIDALHRYARNLDSRDDFIVSKGLWSEFTEQLPPRASGK